MDNKAAARTEPPAPVPDKIGEYRRRLEALQNETRELAQLRAEVLDGAQRGAAAILADTRARIGGILDDARRELSGLLGQLDAMASAAGDDADEAREVVLRARRDLEHLLDEARPDLERLEQDVARSGGRIPEPKARQPGASAVAGFPPEMPPPRADPAANTVVWGTAPMPTISSAPLPGAPGRMPTAAAHAPTDAEPAATASSPAENRSGPPHEPTIPPDLQALFSTTVPKFRTEPFASRLPETSLLRTWWGILALAVGAFLVLLVLVWLTRSTPKTGTVANAPVETLSQAERPAPQSPPPSRPPPGAPEPRGAPPGSATPNASPRGSSPLPSRPPAAPAAPGRGERASSSAQSGTTGGAPVNAAADEAQLLASTQRWLDAYYRHDTAAMRSVGTADMKVADQRAVTERLPASAENARRTLEGVAFQFVGDTSILTAKMTEQGEVGGRSPQFVAWISVMWIRDRGTWRVVDVQILSDRSLRARDPRFDSQSCN